MECTVRGKERGLFYEGEVDQWLLVIMVNGDLHVQKEVCLWRGIVGEGCYLHSLLVWLPRSIWLTTVIQDIVFNGSNRAALISWVPSLAHIRGPVCPQRSSTTHPPALLGSSSIFF